jgi:hypothetical protein
MPKNVIFKHSRLLLLHLTAALVPLFCLLCLGSSSMASRQAPSKEDLPDIILYHVLFRRIEHFEALADKIKAAGKNDADARFAHRQESGLTEKEYKLVRAAAAKAMTRIAELDEVARPLTEANIQEMKRIKSRYTSYYEKLVDLNRQRHAILEQAVIDIKSGLGEKRFAEYDSYLRSTLGSKIGVQRFSR